VLFRKILLAALLCGFVGGGLLGVLQLYTTAPIILAAEVYENHASSDDAGANDPAGKHGFERNLASVAATTVIACAYALILLSVMSLSGRANWRNGVLWGLAGYLVFFAVPAIGMRPEIPGTLSAAIEVRQAWWLTTSAATAAALAMLAFARNWLRLAAIPLLLAPFMFVPPGSAAPVFANTDAGAIVALAALLDDFLIATAATLAVFWIVLGVISGFACERYLDESPGKAG